MMWVNCLWLFEKVTKLRELVKCPYTTSNCWNSFFLIDCPQFSLGLKGTLGSNIQTLTPFLIAHSVKLTPLHLVTLKLQFLFATILTSMLTACLTPNTCLSTPRLKYCIPKINTLQLSIFTKLHCCHHYLIKSLAAAKLLRVCWRTLTTDWLPVPLRTPHFPVWKYLPRYFHSWWRKNIQQKITYDHHWDHHWRRDLNIVIGICPHSQNPQSL